MYWVLIRNLETNEVRVYEESCDWEGEGSVYLWTEGNFACDCNRHLFFERAGGTDDSEGEDCPCGEVIYQVPCAIMQSGRVVELDDPL